MLIKMVGKKKPIFHRQEWSRYRALSVGWRAPKGNQSKLRRHFKAKGHMPSASYRSPLACRGRHPSGLLTAVISNTKELQKINKATHAVYIASGVSQRTRQSIIKQADEFGIRVLNRNARTKTESSILKE